MGDGKKVARPKKTSARRPPAVRPSEIEGLDRIGRRILDELQRDARLTNAELASRVGLSAAACSERVRRLVAEGYVQRFVALLDPARLQVPLLVFIQVVLDRTTPEVFDDFAAVVATIPEVLECHMVAGGFDYLIKARVRDMDAYRELLGRTLFRLRGVRETHTYAVMETVKHETALPLS